MVAPGADASQQTVKCLANPSFAADIDSVVSSRQAVNKALLQDGSGGGTTISVVVIQCPEATSHHVGGSVALIVSGDGRIKVETIPHSIIGVVLSKGELDDKMAMHHAFRHVMQNIIGMPGMWVETAELTQFDNLDTVILASDVLWDNLYRDEAVGQVVHPSLEEAAYLRFGAPVQIVPNHRK
jgi:serine/threonine protein phosphatase PrpC